MFKKYQSGKRIYTTWGKNAEQVTVISKKHRKKEDLPVEFDVDALGAESSCNMANLFMIHHNPEEIIIDFCCVAPASSAGIAGKARVVSRVIMSPRHAKRFLKTLETSLK